LDRAKEKIANLEDELQSTKSRKDAIEADQSQYKIQTDNRIAEMDEDIESLTQQVRDLDEANRDLEDEKETLADQLVQRDQEKLDLQASFDYDANLARARKAVVDDKLATAEVNLKQARDTLAVTSQELDQAEQSLQTAESTLSTVREELAASRQEVEKAQGAVGLLEEAISDQRASLEEKDREIQWLNGLLVARDETVESQVELASIFLRRMSLNVESDIWRNVAQGVLADSNVAPVAQITCQAWRVLPSWSHDESLDIREDDRSIHAVALDILAIIGTPSAPADCLLTRLQSLQDLLSDTSPMVSTVSQLLLRSLADAAGDERLHLMHHVLICQIVDLLNQDAAESIEVNLDSRATTLVSALQAWNAESAAGLQLAAALSYPDLAVVGFNRSPPGIVAVSPLNRELRWIDKAQIRTGFAQIELLSEDGGPMTIALPLDTRERQLWSVAHL
jgi:predicted  nucleic acid-binding Zn-ribbon protein